MAKVRVIIMLTLVVKVLWFYHNVWLQRCNGSFVDCFIHTVSGRSRGILTDALSCFGLSLADIIFLIEPALAPLKLLLMFLFGGSPNNFASTVDWIAAIVLALVTILDALNCIQQARPQIAETAHFREQATVYRTQATIYQE